MLSPCDYVLNTPLIGRYVNGWGGGICRGAFIHKLCAILKKMKTSLIQKIISMKNKQDRILISMILILSLFSFITSCQKLQSYIPVYYNISNETDSKLTVLYNYVPHNGGQEYDTIVRIETGQKRTLLVLLNSHYNLGNPETEDTLTRITLIRVYNDDSTESKKNYRLTKHWKFTEEPSKSDFDLNINRDDF